jgi:hypothetical protein
MSKPSNLTEIDEARRILGMLESIEDTEEYKKIFKIKDADIIRYKNLIKNRDKQIKPDFNN